MDMDAANKDYVFKTIKQRNIHFIRLWFTDALGRMKSFAITPSELAAAFEEGMGFDGGCIEGYRHSDEADMLAFPDATTFQTLPWRPVDNGVARMFCNVVTPSGAPFDGDPRRILSRMLDRVQDLGFSTTVGPKMEFYYFKSPDAPEPIDGGSYFDLTTLDNATDLRRDTVLTLEQMGIPVEYSHHELGPGQQEIHLRADDALSMADAIMTYRLVVKEIAIKHGCHASFMPKPLAGQPGSAMHIHQSLFNFDDDNVFYDADDPSGYGLSALAKSYIAGLIKYAPEFTLITNQYVNSYKRLQPGKGAPVFCGWTNRDRNALVRVPRYKPGKAESARIELRSPDPSCNPYLAFAVMLGAGLKGIEEGLELGPELSEDAITMSVEELEAAGIKRLPRDLGEAVDAFRGSQLMREILGEHMHSYIVQAKQAEWTEYCSTVSAWELDRYLAVL